MTNALAPRPHAAPAPAGEPVTAPLVLPATLTRHWKAVLAITLVSAVAAAAAAKRYGQEYYRVEGTMVYTPLPVADSLRGAYTPPNALTLVGLVKSSHNLEAVVREFGLPVPAKVLDRQLRVTRAHDAESASLSLEWPDPQAGCAIINRVMQLHTEQVAELRRAKVSEGRGLVAAERDRRKDRFDRARLAYTALPNGAGEARLRSDYERLNKECSAADTDLAQARLTAAACEDRLKRCDRRVREIKGAQPRGERPADPADEDDAFFDRKRRDEVLDSLHAAEHQLTEADLKLAAKNRELDSAKALARRQAIARYELERVAAETDLLAAARRNAEASVNRCKRELASLPLQAALRTKADLEAQRDAAAAKAAGLEKLLADKHARAAELGTLLQREAVAAAELREAEAAYRESEDRLVALDRLVAGNVGEFAVLHPAAAAERPANSNRKQLAALAFGALASVGLIGLAGYSRATAPRRPRDPALGLPVLAAATPGEPDCAMRLALRLSRHTAGAGSVLMLSGAGKGDTAEDVACQLSRYLALNGESVLILDGRVDGTPASALLKEFVTLDAAHQPVGGGSARPKSGELAVPSEDAAPAGLVQLLMLSEPQNTAAAICRTTEAAVHYLPAGGPHPTADLLASRSMRVLLSELTTRFDRVLVLGPPLTQPVPCEVMAGYVDGVIVFARESAPAGDAEAVTLRALVSNGVPVLGAVLRP